MPNNQPNITPNNVQSQNQSRINIFDKLHSQKDPTKKSIFSTQTNINKDSNKQSQNTIPVTQIPIGQVPATNIFNANSKINIFGNQNQQVKDPIENKSPISIFNFSTPQKKSQSPSEDQKITDEFMPAIQKKSQIQEVKVQQRKNIIFQIKPRQIILLNSSEKSASSQNNQGNSPNNNSSKHIQLFSRSSSQKKTSKEGSNKKSSESIESSANQKDQAKSIEYRSQSFGSSFYTFQRKNDSRKMDNCESSIGEYLLSQQGTFSFEQKFQTPKKMELKIQSMIEENILSTIKQIQGEESPFHRIQISGNPKSIKTSSSPSYMNDNSQLSPTLSYLNNASQMDDTHSKKTMEKINLRVIESIEVGLQKQVKSDGQKLFQNVHVQSITKSQNKISTRQAFQYVEIQENYGQTSPPKKVPNNQTPSINQKQKQMRKFKDFLDMDSTSKEQQHEVKVHIKRTESQSDSQSPSFSSRDLTASKNQIKSSSKMPYGQATGKLANLNKKNLQTTTPNSKNKLKSDQKLINSPKIQQNNSLKVVQFNQVKEIQINVISQSEEKYQKRQEKQNDSFDSDQKTISLEYSDTPTQKIYSSSNTLALKSLLKEQQKPEIKQKGNKQSNIKNNKKIEEQPNKEEKQQLSKVDDNELQVPQQFNERRITFGKTFEMQSQLKIIGTSTVKQAQNQSEKLAFNKTQEKRVNFMKTQQPPKRQQKGHQQLKSSNKSETQLLQQKLGNTQKKSASKEKKLLSNKDSVSIPKQTQLNLPVIKPTNQLNQVNKKVNLNKLQILSEIVRGKQKLKQIIVTYKKQVSYFKQNISKVKQENLVNIQKQAPQKILKLLIRSNKTQNYLNLQNKTSQKADHKEQQIKIRDISKRTQNLEKLMNLEQKWTKKIQQINHKYNLQLFQQKKEIEKQQKQKNSWSFFNMFNLKKNKFCMSNPFDFKSSLPELKDNSPSKAQTDLQQTLKEITQSMKKREQKCKQKAEKILKLNVIPQISIFINFKKVQKVPVQSKLQEILRRKKSQKQGNTIKKDKRYRHLCSLMFNWQKVCGQSSKHKQSSFYRRINKKFLSNLSKSYFELKLQREEQYIDRQRAQLDFQKSQWLINFEEQQRRQQIRNQYENRYNNYKRIKKMVGAYEDDFQTPEEKFENQRRKKQQNILKKKEHNQEIQIKKNQNISVKLSRMKFKKQVFYL